MIKSELQDHLFNSQWAFNLLNITMFDLDHESLYAKYISYTNFRRETIDVSQSIKASVEKRLIHKQWREKA